MVFLQDHGAIGKIMARTATIREAPTPIGQSPAFLDMLAHVSRAAPLNRPVLVVGERGTGKELVASRLAFLSARWERPFIALNCAALPETLLDSELFGHEAGAFTGAARRRAGRFELADGGTLLLDEIATAAPAVQEKLLRVIEYGAFERVGGSETVRVDVRLIAATNVDLPALADAGKFRADLLDRLAFDVVTVPPLRARAGDVAVLAEHFARRMTSELDRRAFAGFTGAAMQTLERHHWPGNVRELRNVVERSVYRMASPDRPLAHLVLDPFASPFRPAAAPASIPPPAPVPAEVAVGDYAESTGNHARNLLLAALLQTRHNQAAAARLLGLSYYQFRHQLRLHKVFPD